MRRTPTFPRGGIVIPSRAAQTRDAPLSNAPIPAVAIVALRQHQGKPAEPLVRAGQEVGEGEPIGRPADADSAIIHAPIPGRVKEICETIVPDGSRSPAVVIELGGAFAQSGRPRQPLVWEEMQPRELLTLVRDAGVVELAGAPVPVAERWRAARERRPRLLIANGIEGEPYLAAEYRLLVERPREVAEGLRIAQRALGAPRVALALSEDCAEVGEAVVSACANGGVEVEVSVFQDRYPQGEERQLAAAALGARTPPQGPPIEAGVVVSSIATLLAVREAVAIGRPLIERAVTVAGPGVREARNLKVRLGTRIGELIDEAGGVRRAGPIVLGGPMRGTVAESLDVPFTKSVGGVLVLDRRESGPRTSWPCIRCGRCVDACPWGLSPVRLYKLAAAGLSLRASSIGLARCEECGCCSFVCPSRIPLAATLRAGKLAAGDGAGGAA